MILPNVHTYHADCLTAMAQHVPDGSVNLIITDLPYGLTKAHCDVRIPLAPMWEQFKRVTKPNAAIVLFSQLPFSSDLIQSNLDMFRYEWIWEKNIATRFFNAKDMPLRSHENILVFYQQKPTYNPQFRPGKPYRTSRRGNFSQNYSTQRENETLSDGRRYPIDIIQFDCVSGSEKTPHPQQKPVALLEYLIRTYTNEGDTVLDATMGSGTTGVAAINTGRNFIGFEIVEEYFNIAEARLAEALQRNAA